MKRVHDTREQVRAEIVAAGYQSGFSSPGRPELWLKGKSRMAIQRQVDGADERWVIMPYPEPATCLAAQAHELALRDGAVLAAGKVLPQPSEVTLVAAYVDDPDSDLL